MEDKEKIIEKSKGNNRKRVTKWSKESTGRNKKWEKELL